VQVEYDYEDDDGHDGFAGPGLAEPGHAAASSAAGNALCTPSAAQLAALVAVPAGMVSTMQSRGRNRRKGKRRSDAKFYNVAAGRPYPRLTSMQQAITVTVSTTIVSFVTSSSTPVYASKSFSLVDFGGTSSYLTVFDQYRFDMLEVWLEPMTGTSVNGYPAVASCVDNDDANVPTTYNSIADHQEALVGEGQAGRYHKWKPHMAVAVFSGAFTSYGNQAAGWIDSSSTAVQHYGFKVGVLGASTTTAYTLTARATLSFRAAGIN